MESGLNSTTKSQTHATNNNTSLMLPVKLTVRQRTAKQKQKLAKSAIMIRLFLSVKFKGVIA